MKNIKFKETNSPIDNLGKVCKKCKIGKYIEKNIEDVRYGDVHCNQCNNIMKRWTIY